MQDWASIWVSQRWYNFSSSNDLKRYWSYIWYVDKAKTRRLQDLKIIGACHFIICFSIYFGILTQRSFIVIHTVSTNCIFDSILLLKKVYYFYAFFYFMLDTVRIDDKKNFKDLNNKSGYVLYIYFIYPFLDVVKFYKILKMMCFCSI